jgi:hypothetical protein
MDAWTGLIGCFPQLTKEHVWITDECTDTYNCIAWSLGYTDRWINPTSPSAILSDDYQDEGCTAVPYADPDAYIDAWYQFDAAQSIDEGTHGSTKYVGEKSNAELAGLWESKLGSSFRLYDTLQEEEPLLITYSANDAGSVRHEGEQSRARRTIKNWIKSRMVCRIP